MNRREFKAFGTAILMAILMAILFWLLISACTRSVFRTVAEGALERTGFTVVALDRTDRFVCPKGGRGYTFHATRAGHLYAGGVCAGPFLRRAVIVTLPALT
jgi:hypothetical protein